MYEAQFYVRDRYYDFYEFDGLIYDHATYGWGSYQRGWDEAPWCINRIWGQGVPFTIDPSGNPIPGGGGPSNGGGNGNPKGGGTGNGNGGGTGPTPDRNGGDGGGLFGS